jgi:hypothetical protein
VNIRRVVTGHDQHGKAVFVSDQRVPPVEVAVLPGFAFHRLWGADQAPHFPDDGTMPSCHEYFPPLGGFRFAFFTLPPATTAAPPATLDPETGMQEFEAKLPGLAKYLEGDHAPGTRPRRWTSRSSCQAR